MILKEVGYFKELEHGRKSGPSLNENISKVPIDDEEKIIEYLKRGIDFIASPGIVYDVLNNTKVIGGLNILTDGIWMWPSDLAYYVENYHVKLPEEFISQMKKRNWKEPREDEIDFSTIKILNDTYAVDLNEL